MDRGEQKMNKEKVMSYVFLAISTTTILCVILICSFLLINGFPVIKQLGFRNFIFNIDWAPTDIPASYGILPMILGSVVITIGAIIIGVPIGIMTAIYLAKYCPKKIYPFLKNTVDLLAGIPSIVFGFFGLVIIVPFVRTVFGYTGKGILSASILLGLMILPTIICITETSINTVPEFYYEGALALGASHERAIYSIVLPAAKRGIFSSVILGIGRAIGETMAVVMVAGNQTILPTNILKGARTLTTNIVIEMGYATGFHRQTLIATGLILFIFILLINCTFVYLNRKDNK